MSLELITYILTMDKEECAKAWCDFNSWEFPKNLPQKFKPSWWDNPKLKPFYDRSDINNLKQGYNEIIMSLLCSLTTEKLIQKAWKEKISKNKKKKSKI